MKRKRKIPTSTAPIQYSMAEKGEISVIKKKKHAIHTKRQQ
jgi:hypothetical protein